MLSLLEKTMVLGILGGQEIVIIAVIILLLFGVQKIPALMRNLGKGVRDFNDSTEDVKETLDEIKDIKKIIP